VVLELELRLDPLGVSQLGAGHIVSLEGADEASARPLLSGLYAVVIRSPSSCADSTVAVAVYCGPLSERAIERRAEP
jgi:hypothetical protein